MQIDLLERYWSSKSMSELDKNLDLNTLSYEDHIVRIAQFKCRNSFAILFKAFAPRLKAFLMGKGLNSSQAEDLAQDALLSVWRKASYFDPKRAKASTWMFTIARNLRIDLARKENRYDKLPEDLWHEFDVDSPEDTIQKVQKQDNLNQIINALPEDLKSILRLWYIEDLSHAQIAEYIKLPLGTVKSRLRLAIARIKDNLSQNSIENRHEI